MVPRGFQSLQSEMSGMLCFVAFEKQRNFLCWPSVARGFFEPSAVLTRGVLKARFCVARWASESVDVLIAALWSLGQRVDRPFKFSPYAFGIAR